MNQARPSLIRTTCALLFVLMHGIAFAEDEAGTAAPPEPPPIPDTLKSPRATMETFLAAMKATREGNDQQIEQAITTLDLSEVNPLVRAEKGRDLAWTLQEVIDRTRIPDTERFSTRTEGKPFTFHTYESGKVEIVFKEHEGWRFSTTTVAALPTVLDEISEKEKVEGADQAETARLPIHLRVRGMIPAQWKEQSFVLEHWQWLGIFAIILAGIVLDKLVSLLLSVFVRIWRTRFAKGSFREISDSILRPFGLMAMAFAWWAGLNMLGLPAEVLVILLVSVKFLACLSTVWGAYRLVDLIAAFLKDAAAKTSSKLDDALVPLVTKTMKVFVTVMGIVFIADNLDIDVTSLLAGLGLGGLAFALAAKDVAANLFGSVTVLLDQTFHVGDWVIVGDVEGSVEHIGFRSTRIRTFYDSQVSVPNSTLITASVDNMGKRSYRRLSCKLSIAYDTPPDRIEAFCEGIRELVRQHPYMRKDYYHVYLNEFSASALEILVYVFWKTPEWATELRERHRFLIDCLRLAQRLGVEYAYPTQTLYMKQAESGLLAPEAGEFTPPKSQQEAFALGREQAQSIVAATTGLGVVPPPVEAGGAGSSADGE
ncbi:MAG: mechanosensitive ion channel family protein [Gammaproteobacteria bacterium]|nr:mechanosensitive ion channel family protein [Gammaproteobacteria bacterium]HJP37397.1 mechanosensitive ion channel family protein [Gammaproteobacteria bacterium]